jgi:hypothetical protein
MNYKKLSLPLGLIALVMVLVEYGWAQIGAPEIFPFMKENTILLKTAGGYNFDNDEYLDLVGIAASVDANGEAVPRSTYVVHLEESAANDFNVQWKYPVPADLKADFSDILVTDLDNDGLPEIVTTLNISDVESSGQPDWLYVFEYNDGFPDQPTATLNTMGSMLTRPRPSFLDCGDINGDKNPDIVISSGSPGRGIMIVSSQGQVAPGSLEVIGQIGNLSTFEGALSFRALCADLVKSPGDELVIFGGSGTLNVDVYAPETKTTLVQYSFAGIPRRDFDLNRIAAGDLDGDGRREFIIPLKSGGGMVLTCKDNTLVARRLLSKNLKLAALMVADLNANGLDELYLNCQGTTTVSCLEYDLTGALTDSNSYRSIRYTNPMLKGYQFIDIVPVTSAAGKYTGSIILPFLQKSYNKHGLCRWKLEDTAPFMEEGPIEEVLAEVDQVLGAKRVPSGSEEGMPLAAADKLIKDLSGAVGKEVPLSPLPSSVTGMVSTKSISEVFHPDVLVHPGEKVSRKITVPGLSLDDLTDLEFNVKIPDGAKFDLANKEFTWFPADSQLGLHTLGADFNWGKNKSAHSFTVYVNDPPVITTKFPERDVIQIGETFKLTIDVKDSNENAFLGYKLVNYPAGAIIDAAGNLTWKPSFDQHDWYDFVIEVSDGYDTDKIAFSLFVNHPVEIESAAPPLTTVGSPYHYQPVLKDKNNGFYVYWYDQSPRIEDWKNSGIYEVKILDDGVRNTLGQYIARYKRDFIPKTDPTKKSKKIHLIDDAFLFEGKLILVFNVLDNKVPSGEDVVKYFFQNLGLSTPAYAKPERHFYYVFTPKEMPQGMSMNAEGVADWVPDKNQFDYHSIAYTVTDGYFTAEEHAQVYVNSPPVVVSTPDSNAYVNSLWQYEIKVTDLNTDSKLSYELIKAPDGMVISPQGVISWTPTDLQLNNNLFSFKVSDGMKAAIQKGRIFVNIKPNILSVPKPVALTNLKWEYRLEAEDPNGDPIVYKADKLPKNARFDPETGMLTWNPRKSQKGVNDVVLEVVDSHGWSTLQEFQVHVFHNPGAQRLNFLRNTVSLLALMGLIYLLVTMK